MNKFSTWLWRTAFWLRYKVGYGLKVYGRDNFPMEGPVIVVPNHLSNNDPPICGYALPRHVHFMAKQELFVNPISRFICTWLGAFPLNRGAIDKVAVRFQVDNTIRLQKFAIPFHKIGRSQSLGCFLHLRVREGKPYFTHFAFSKKTLDDFNIGTQESDILHSGL